MRKSIKTEAIVLTKKNLLGRDLLLVLFTKEAGKVKVLAKGVKKITSRRSPHIQSGNLIEVWLHRKKDIYHLDQSKLISGFTLIKQNSVKIDLVYRFFFILDRLLPEEEKEMVIFSASKRFLVELSNDPDFNQEKLNSYINRVLRLLGYTKEDLHSNELLPFIEEIIREKIPAFVI
ncbi:DNA repair protein RecO [Candidatus Roizmanbacteria bacterium]|jgi:DNA repair protein RecO (recombination protein O)|nr:DNA repair protein RecO [Candidatus Roizmanbacteria bacterium]